MSWLETNGINGELRHGCEVLEVNEYAMVQIFTPLNQHS